MGGFGSGKKNGKRVVGDLLALDIRRIQRCGRLPAGQHFNWEWTRGGEPAGNINIRTYSDLVTLTYRARGNGGDWREMKYSVRLSWTPCNYGGHRAWWLCPVEGCERRVAVLYGGSVYACRHCHELAYRTQREHSSDRAASKADKLRVRLGWEPGILNGNGHKPKGMHWRTFEQLQTEHDSYVNHSLAGTMAWLKLIGEGLER